MNKELFGNNERPFKVPENYFEDFDNRLMQKIEAEESSNAKKSPLAPVISVIKPWLAMAAAFLLIALIYHQVPGMFKSQEKMTEKTESDDDFFNSIALIIDENDINELIVNQDSTFVLPPDSLLIGDFTEEELAALTYFE